MSTCAEPHRPVRAQQRPRTSTSLFPDAMKGGAAEAGAVAAAGAGAGAGAGVREWYAGRTLLVTGGAGFIGKVLLEKMLRALPDLERIYVLLRPKRGMTPARRLEAALALPLFERLRAERPEALAKLHAVEGDLLADGLGLSAGDRARLQAEVSVLVHGAASLRLEAQLGPALRHNLLGTQRVLELARSMPRLEAFVHLSTAFCHPEQERLYERVYPARAQPEDLLRMARCLDDEALHLLSPKLLGPHPNTYVYTKQLAEALVAQARPEVPVLVVRPSVVIPAFREPLEGWVDTLNGPVGLVVGAGKGVIRSMMCGRHYTSETIPVDVVANVVIAAAWDSAVNRAGAEEPPVYNASSSDVVRVTWGEVLDRGVSLVREYPFEGVAWWPDGDVRESRALHTFIVFAFHLLPAYLIDLLLVLALQKPFMVRVQKRISVGLEVLQFFTMRQWNFDNANGLELERRLSDEERRIFYISDFEVNVPDYLLKMLLGARQYCMKEPLSSLPRARRHLKLMYVVHTVAKILFWMLMFYLAFKLIEPLRFVLDRVSDGLFTSSFRT